MNNDTIKLLNLEHFKINIKTLDTAKVNNVLYCYITLEKETVTVTLKNLGSSVNWLRDGNLISKILL